MTRAKASKKVVEGLGRRRDFLSELAKGVMSVLVIRAEGNLAFARNLADDGLINLGPDMCTIMPAGREWLKNYGGSR